MLVGSRYTNNYRLHSVHGTARQQGFTIIEILIVLAIAGLIMIIIFFAVPALQRNSRNTQLRNDANVVLGFVNEYAANNNGTMPAAACIPSTTDGKVYLSSDATCDATDTLGGNIRGGITLTNATTTAEANTQAISVHLNRKCAAAGAVAASATNRAVAITYKTETSGSNTARCVES